MRPAANLSYLFAERPLAERIRAARTAGFDAVELLFPYGEDLGALGAALEETGAEMLLINTPPGDWDAGERGHAALKGEETRFRRGFARALEAAEALGASRIHVLAGRTEGPAAEDTFRANLAWASAMAPGLTLTIEPLNPADQPGYFLARFEQAARILDDLALPGVALQFDAYHAWHIEHGDVCGAWERHGARAAHVQIADAPGRHEPGTGRIDFPAFFAALRKSGYTGAVSGEYLPLRPTEETLGWAFPGL